MSLGVLLVPTPFSEVAMGWVSLGSSDWWESLGSKSGSLLFLTLLCLVLIFLLLLFLARWFLVELQLLFYKLVVLLYLVVPPLGVIFPDSHFRLCDHSWIWTDPWEELLPICRLSTFAVASDIEALCDHILGNFDKVGSVEHLALVSRMDKHWHCDPDFYNYNNILVVYSDTLVVSSYLDSVRFGQVGVQYLSSWAAVVPSLSHRWGTPER